jgi:hypothetical protein
LEVLPTFFSQHYIMKLANICYKMFQHFLNNIFLEDYTEIF